jgi:hypothetical protein
MNVREWESALSKAGLLPEFQDVLEGFVNGFHQGIPPHSLAGNQTFFSPPNHLSALLAKEKIEESLEKEISKGRMFGPYTVDEVLSHFPFFRTNPLGAVTNGDGSFRPTNDLSFPHGNPNIPSVNSFVDPEDFKTTWDDFNVVSRFFRSQTQPCLLAIFDWEKAYRQIPTAVDQWPYLMVRDFNDHIILDTRITFGGVAGCGSFGRPADAWKRLMLKEFDLTTIFRWVDDNLFVKEVSSPTDMDHVVARSNELGVKTNPTKISPFKDEQKYIGFVWNAAAKTVRLPDGKLFERIQQIKSFLEPSRLFSFKEAEQMAGRLNHVSYLLPQLKCYLCGLYRWMKSWKHKNVSLPIPNDAKLDLDEWLRSLLFIEPTRLIASPDPTEVGWMGDASTSFGIGVTIGRRWAQFQVIQGWNQGTSPLRDIAWLETVAIRIGLLMMIELGLNPGKTLIVWTDNTTSQNALLKRRSNSYHVNEEWKSIQDLLLLHQVDIVPKRVTSEDNVADRLSRGDSTGFNPSSLVRVPLPLDLEERLFQVL